MHLASAAAMLRGVILYHRAIITTTCTKLKKKIFNSTPVKILKISLKKNFEQHFALRKFHEIRRRFLFAGIC